jgi:hypothetical protein
MLRPIRIFALLSTTAWLALAPTSDAEPPPVPTPPFVLHGLSDEQVRAVVVAHTGALRACYEVVAKDEPSLRGGLDTTWQVEADGTVSTASIRSSTLQNARVESCIIRQIKSWTFPTSDRATIIASYPFRFGVKG